MDSAWQLWGYVAACVVVPAAWGVLSAWVFQRLDRRKQSLENEAARRPPVDYSI